MFYEIFTKLCDEKGISPTATLQNLKISTSKLTAWKKGSLPSASVLILLSEFFQVSIDYILTGKEKKSPQVELTDTENNLLSDFRSLSSQGKAYIRQQMFIAREVYKKQDISEADINVG